MKKAFLFLVTIIACQNLYADGTDAIYGTCTSESSRIILQTYDEFVNEDIRIYTLTIDGLATVFDLRDEHNDEVGDDGYLEIHSEGLRIFTIDRHNSTLTIHNDPTQGRVDLEGALETPLEVDVNCTFKFSAS